MSAALAVRPMIRAPGMRRPRLVGGLVVLVGVVVVGALISLVVGSRLLSVGQTLTVLLHPDSSEASAIVHGLRVPRTLLAIMVGMALGVAGTVIQGHTRNPLADPGLLGVSAGASAAVVLGIYWLGVTSPLGYAWLALGGAGIAAVAVFGIGSARGGPSPVTLVLAGAAVSALLSTITQALVLARPDTLEDYRFWVVGSLVGRGTAVLVQLAPLWALGLVLAAINAPGLNVGQLGDDVAASLGIDPMRHRVIGIAAVMLLTGAATAACGPIGFVGLVVPHVARFGAGLDYRWLMPYAGLIGAVLVLGADVIGRVIVVPGELQVGIVMAMIGGPIFIALVRRSRLVAL